GRRSYSCCIQGVPNAALFPRTPNRAGTIKPPTYGGGFPPALPGVTSTVDNAALASRRRQAARCAPWRCTVVARSTERSPTFKSFAALASETAPIGALLLSALTLNIFAADWVETPAIAVVLPIVGPSPTRNVAMPASASEGCETFAPFPPSLGQIGKMFVNAARLQRGFCRCRPRRGWAAYHAGQCKTRVATLFCRQRQLQDFSAVAPSSRRRGARRGCGQAARGGGSASSRSAARRARTPFSRALVR